MMFISLSFCFLFVFQIVFLLLFVQVRTGTLVCYSPVCEIQVSCGIYLKPKCSIDILDQVQQFYIFYPLTFLKKINKYLVQPGL